MTRPIEPVGPHPVGADPIERVALLDRVQRDLRREERERKRRRERGGDEPRHPATDGAPPRLDVRG